ncbi:MAG: tetratricopeptide repeat protein [Symploca sp. SIO3E6]|nr:tetratricopeptide repeat protein [Caldora sp. SIO3E6]
MDEKQRLQEYVKLIEELLNCPDGEEAQILNANRELVDAGLLQVMAQVAEQLEADGNQNAADFLRDLNSQLVEVLEISETTSANPSSQDYEKFLMEVLQATVYSIDNPEVIYNLLQANLDKLDDTFIIVLQNWAETKLSEVESSKVEYIASVIVEFSNLIRNFPPDNKAIGMEIAIAGYKVAQNAFTRESNPETWVNTQNNLGVAYWNRTLGNRAENLEMAFDYFQQTLFVYTKEVFPTEWASTQNNLGVAYCKRMLGDKAENLESAITCFQQTLFVYTKEAFPTKWAKIQSNLGVVYHERRLGDKAENLESAITCFQQALSVYTKEAFPTKWADTQNSLGNVYLERIIRDMAENLELAIAAYQQALSVYTKEAFPIDWAGIRNNLGIAYSDRILGDKTENLEMAIAAYQQALEVYTKEAFPTEWAMTQNNLGNAYRDRILGDIAENLEMAMTALQQALSVRTKEAFPTKWADTQNNLGIAYSDRILGDKAENLEMAIAAYQQALSVRTKEAFPTDWADTQNNLGLTYNDRILGDKAENLEMAIAAYQQVLEVYTKEAFPTKWAGTQNNLGNAYRDRIRGDRAENLEIAIAAYQQALSVRTKEAFPIDWATTQNNLGAAYAGRIRGDKAENLEMAIAAYQQALSVRTKEAFPINWATTQNNLGAAYSDRILGDMAENLEMAIAAYEKALEIRTKEAFPTDWADIQNNLSLAYTDRILGDIAENPEMAIVAYQRVLEVHTKETFPTRWAMTQNNLGIAYCERILGDRAENLETAIAAYEQALEVYTKEAFPSKWAGTQNNLGMAYSKRILGDNTENLEMAIAAYEKALEVRTLTANVIEHFITTRNLGNLYFNQGNWQPAIDAYEKAITATEFIRNEGITDKHRNELLAGGIKVYQKQVQSYINTQQWDKAIETVERSKTRNLVELLANRDLYPKGDVPQEIIFQLDRLRRSIPSLERQLQVVIEQLSTTTSEQEQAQRHSLEESQRRLQQELQSSRQQLDEVLNQIKPIDSSFSLTQRVEQIAFSEIQSLLDERTAAIEWYVTEDKILTFILTTKSLHPLVEQASVQELEALENWGNDYLAAYQKENKQWKTNIASNLEKLAEILNIDRLLTQVDEIFDQQGGKCDRLILIPHRFLHLFPFHAMPLANGDLLMERFPRGLSYAPSIQLLQLSQTWSRPSLKHFFSLKNPTEDLSFANLEVDTIRSYFHPNDDVLEKQAASKTALTQERLAQTNVAHFSCHGYFNFETPSQSALVLAGGKTTTTITPAEQTRFWESRDGGAINLEKCLTLGDIFALDLRQCRLTTLSACETGLTDVKSLGDEYIGLPSGFLYAGSPSVVSSLWTVDDLSTAFLTIQFYQNLQDTEQYPSVAIALNQAQLWLRNLTKKKLEIWMAQNQLKLAPAPKMSLSRRLHKMSDNAQPFKSPFYWAAFCAIGQ